MSEINISKIVGDTFEDMSLAEMTLVQGSGDISGEFTTSPVCVYSILASSEKCGKYASALITVISSAIISAVNC